MELKLLVVIRLCYLPRELVHKLLNQYHNLSLPTIAIGLIGAIGVLLAR